MDENQPNSYDVIIIGAGPAGVSTALHLLQIDPAWAGRVLVLEKATHPRHKLCGGGLTYFGLRLLQDLGFALPLPLPHAAIEDVHLAYAGRMVHMPGRPRVAIFHRPELDAYLLDQARQRGVQVHENEAVERFAIDAQGVSVQTWRASYRASALVGADGANGITRQALRKGEAGTRVARVLESLSPASEDAPPFAQRTALFDFTPTSQRLQGYAWEFPSFVAGQATFNRGAYDARIARRRARANLRALLSAFSAERQPGAGVPLPAGHPIHWFSPRGTFARPRLLLVGDAAGVDPLFGEGIAPALGYGQVAAQSIQRAFQRGDFSFRDHTWRLALSPVGRYLFVRWCVAWWGYRLSGQAWFMDAVWTLGRWLACIWPQSPALY
ncbi:MAG: FAD-dependent monooxygenase [Anaerolineales bacterium]|nr:FAD-dependent monooxygenase [Anaerolineales bacterium]